MRYIEVRDITNAATLRLLANHESSFCFNGRGCSSVNVATQDPFFSIQNDAFQILNHAVFSSGGKS